MYDLGPVFKPKQLYNRNELVFLPGNHSLSESTLTLTNVSNITLKGEQLVIITCTNITTIQCENVTDMKIEGLVFLQYYTDKQDMSALYLINSYGVAISRTTFQGVGTNKTNAGILYSHYSKMCFQRYCRWSYTCLSRH